MRLFKIAILALLTASFALPAFADGYECYCPQRQEQSCPAPQQASPLAETASAASTETSDAALAWYADPAVLWPWAVILFLVVAGLIFLFSIGRGAFYVGKGAMAWAKKRRAARLSEA